VAPASQLDRFFRFLRTNRKRNTLYHTICCRVKNGLTHGNGLRLVTQFRKLGNGPLEVSELSFGTWLTVAGYLGRLRRMVRKVDSGQSADTVQEAQIQCNY
jgi:hypothetical protein